MSETNIHSTTPLPAGKQIAIFVHAKGRSGCADDWVRNLLNLGRTVYSQAALEGCVQTRHGMANAAALIQELSELAPGQPLVLLRAPVQLGRAEIEQIEWLLTGIDGSSVITALSNSEAAMNPWAGLAGDSSDGETRSHKVRWLGAPRMHELRDWAPHFTAISVAAVNTSPGAHQSWQAMMDGWRADGGQLLVPEQLYLHDPDCPADAQAKLEPHERPRPVAWSRLAQALYDWRDGSMADLPERPGLAPTSLHITHSWGGGVAAWIDSFIEADTDSLNLQLRSEGPQSGQGAGQCLALYAGNQLEQPLARWWLQPPIAAVDTKNPQYCEILARVIQTFCVGRIIVSSLVGHSLDALRSDLPTIEVLHDHFPAWPLLSSDPGRHDNDLKKAAGDRHFGQEFPALTTRAWKHIHQTQLDALAQHNVALAAPSGSVVNIQNQLDKRWRDLPISIIPHGLPPLDCGPEIASRARKDGRLRVIIPGRIQAGKGSELLMAALPELIRHAQVYLLGTGQGGQAFFGQSGVHVILNYDRAELPGLVRSIGPDLAILASVVPETFSYTLSEMNALGVPVLATSMGSFLERITDGETGWLVAPEAADLAQRLAALAGDRQAITAVRNNLTKLEQRSTQAMVADYDELATARLVAPVHPNPAPMGLDQTQATALHGQHLDDQLRADRSRQNQAGLKQEISERTQWAESASRDLENEVKRRRKWVTSLESHISEQDINLAESRSELDGAQNLIEAQQSRIDVLGGRFENLRARHETVLTSSSWRITKPLRLGRRMGSNFMQARAWNPLRWPLLASQLVRNLATVGPKGTLLRMQSSAHQAEPLPEPFEAVAEPTSLEPPASVPQSDQPRVSIVIPVYDQLAYTIACLSSLATTSTEVEFEIIVIDDESADETAESLPGVEGLTYLRNEKNLGFIGSCNRGAVAAKGEFVVFLNNDTEVQDGWMDALVDTFLKRPDAGLVGARLLYPDGSLQECGGLVFSDGSGWNYGRGDDPTRPEYRCLRETDYCSGAAIMLRKTLFEALGGFDSRYAPAYYEDTDLAFKVREAGLKVYVQPAATVIHHEGITSGTDLDSGTKKYQRINQETFRERWAEQLAAQPARIENPDDPAAIRSARDHRLRGRVLVIDAYTPEPDQDSGSVRLSYLLNCLQSLGFGVSFLPDNRAYAGHYTRALQNDGVEAQYLPWVDSLHGFLRERGREFNAVIISRHYVAVNYLTMLKRYCPQAKFIFDTVDLHYLREQRQAELEQSLPLERVARQTRRSELSVIDAADATLVVSPVEKEVLAGDAPGAEVHVLSNIHEVTGRQTGFSDRRDLFFVGGYQHPPNVDAARWFVNDIWPLIHAALPDVKFHLVGSKAPDAIRNLQGEGVVFHGFVPTLDPFLETCRMAVAPLRYGAGVKGKVNHSMAHGQPVVATGVATEGMFAEDGREVLVADEAADFAAAVVRLYDDETLWNHLSDNGIRNVEAYFSMDAARGALRQLFKSLGLG